jgi:hypothetical protein
MPIYWNVQRKMLLKDYGFALMCSIMVEAEWVAGGTAHVETCSLVP